MSASWHHLSFASILVRQSGPGVGGAHRAEAHLAGSTEPRRHVAQLVAQDHRQRVLHWRSVALVERMAHLVGQAVDGRQSGARLLDAQLGDSRVSRVQERVHHGQEEAPLSRVRQGLLRQVLGQETNHSLVVAHRQGARLRCLLRFGRHRRAQDSRVSSKQRCQVNKFKT